MVFQLFTIVTVVAISLFLTRRKHKKAPTKRAQIQRQRFKHDDVHMCGGLNPRFHKPPIRSDVSIGTGYGISMTDREVELERQSNEEIMQLLEARIVSSGFFRAEKITELMAKLREGSSPFARVNTNVAFDGGAILTVEEKRVLGLNTKMKYSKNFIEYFDPIVFKKIEPKNALTDMHLDAFHRVARKKELRELKELNVRQVDILPAGDARDCGKIKRFKKTHRINEVPELPLPGCTAPYCRCMYLAKDI